MYWQTSRTLAMSLTIFLGSCGFSAVDDAAAASLRFLNLVPNLDELMNEPPQR